VARLAWLPPMITKLAWLAKGNNMTFTEDIFDTLTPDVVLVKAGTKVTEEIKTWLYTECSVDRVQIDNEWIRWY